jgi:Skp family chaperone for outer membrane proteins
LKEKFRAATAAITLVAALFISGPAHSATTNPSPKIAVGVVDMSRVMNEAKTVSALQTELKDMRDAQQKTLDNLYAGRLLNPDERTELETLQKTASPSATQTARITELTKLSDTREEELKRLSRLEKPTDADRARITELSNWLDKQNQRATQLREQYDNDTQQKVSDINQRAMDSVLGAVKAVAQDQGLALVVEKQAVLFSIDSLDMTDEVLNRLNGTSAKASPASGKG